MIDPNKQPQNWTKILTNPRAAILELDGWDRWRYWVITVATGVVFGIYAMQITQNPNSNYLVAVFGGVVILIAYSLVFGGLISLTQRLFGVKLSFYQIQLALGWGFAPVLILFTIFIIFHAFLKNLLDPIVPLVAIVGSWYFFQTYSSLGKKTYGSAWLIVQAAGVLFAILVGIGYGIFQAVNQ